MYLRSGRVGLERLTANARVLGSIPASSNTVESEERRIKQCWKMYKKLKPKQVLLSFSKSYIFPLIDRSQEAFSASCIQNPLSCFAESVTAENRITQSKILRAFVLSGTTERVASRISGVQKSTEQVTQCNRPWRFVSDHWKGGGGKRVVEGSLDSFW